MGLEKWLISLRLFFLLQFLGLKLSQEIELLEKIGLKRKTEWIEKIEWSEEIQ